MSASTLLCFRDVDNLGAKLDRLVAAAGERPLLYQDVWLATRSDALRTALEFGLRELLARMDAPLSDREIVIAQRRAATERARGGAR